MKKLKESAYQFKPLKKVKHKGLSIKIPEWMYKDFYKSYVYKTSSLAYQNADAALYITVEHFSNDEAEDIQFSYENELTPLEAVNQFYIDLRCNSLYDPDLSITKKAHTKQQNPFFYQFIKGSNYEGEVPMFYMQAAVMKLIDNDSSYYLIQMMCNEDLAPYLKDDFMRLTKTME